MRRLAQLLSMVALLGLVLGLPLGGNVADAGGYKIAPAGGGASATELAWSDSTELDPAGMESGGSTWGSGSATAVLDAVHGDMDLPDAYVRYWDIGARPADKRVLVLTLTLGASQNANASGGNENLMLGAMSEAPMADNDGLYGGFQQNNADSWRMLDGNRVGSVGAGGVIGDPSGETLTVVLPFGDVADAEKMFGLFVLAEGATSVDGDFGTLSAVSIPTDIYPFVAFGLNASSPSAGQTWPLSTVTYEWAY